MSSRYDAVVIGAGVMGASISLELARGGRTVLCVDAGPAVGAGSTSSSSAVIRFNYSTWDSVLLAWEAGHRWKNLGSYLGDVDAGELVRYIETGAFVLDTPGQDPAAVVEHFQRAGIPYEDWSAEQLAERMPWLAQGDFYPPRPVDDPTFADEPTKLIGGYYTPEGGFVDDPMRAAQNFMAAAKQNGAEVRLNSRVTEIRREGRQVLGVTLESGEAVDAAVVVNAAGPASRRMNEMAGVLDEMQVASRPLRQEVQVIKAPDSYTVETGSLVADPGVGVYFRPHLAGTVLIGGTEPDCDPLHWVDDPEVYNANPTPEVFEAQVLRTARRLHELRIPLQPTGLAALYDASDDWVPLYDNTSLHGFFMACGTSGNQFKNAPMVGTMITALVDAQAAGQDHDTDPVQVRGDATGDTINMASFSRLREKSTTSNSVLG